MRVIRWPERWAKLAGGWVCTQGREPHVSACGQLQFADEGSGLVTHLRIPAPDRMGALCLQRGVCESKSLPGGYATCPWRTVLTLRSQSSESEVILRQVSSCIWILQMGERWAEHQGAAARRRGCLGLWCLQNSISKYRPCIPKFPSEQTGPGDSPTLALHLIPRSQVIPLTRNQAYTTTGEKEHTHLWSRLTDTGTLCPRPFPHPHLLPPPSWLCFSCPRRRTFPGPPLPDTGSGIRG